MRDDALGAPIIARNRRGGQFVTPDADPSVRPWREPAREAPPRHPVADVPAEPRADGPS
ncbi:MAG: hypothetical protein ACRDGV_01680 [Candidatus Limnocylindria bacterium]